MQRVHIKRDIRRVQQVTEAAVEHKKLCEQWDNSVDEEAEKLQAEEEPPPYFFMEPDAGSIHEFFLEVSCFLQHGTLSYPIFSIYLLLVKYFYISAYW